MQTTEQVKRDFLSAIHLGSYAYAKQIQQRHSRLNKWFDLEWQKHCDLINHGPDGDVEEEGERAA